MIVCLLSDKSRPYTFSRIRLIEGGRCHDFSWFSKLTLARILFEVELFVPRTRTV